MRAFAGVLWRADRRRRGSASNASTSHRDGRLGYGLGEWDAARCQGGLRADCSMTTTPRPTHPLAEQSDQKAAAVQAPSVLQRARVLNASDVAAERRGSSVNEAKFDGPLDEPRRGRLTNTTPSCVRPVDRRSEFTVSIDAGQRRTEARASGQATVTARGGSMSSAAAECRSLMEPASGSRYGATGVPAVLQPRRRQRAQRERHRRRQPAGVNDAQRLILAENATLTKTVQAIEFLERLVIVKKTMAVRCRIAGADRIDVTCTDGVDGSASKRRGHARRRRHGHLLRDPGGRSVLSPRPPPAALSRKSVVVPGPGSRSASPQARERRST